MCVQELVLTFYHVDPEVQTQAFRIGSKHPHLLDPLAGPEGTKLQQVPTKGTERNPFPGFRTHHKPLCPLHHSSL